MKFYKKLIALSLVGAMALGMSACGEKAEKKEDTKKVEVEATDEKKEEKKDSENEAVKTDGEEATSNEETENLKGLAIEDVIKNPSKLKELTGVEEEYDKYINNMTPTSAYFVYDDDEKTNAVQGSIHVYTKLGAEDSTGLYMYLEGARIVEAKLDEFTGMVDESWKDSENIVYGYAAAFDTQRNEKNIEVDFSDKELAEKELKEKFEGKDINELREFIGIYSPVTKFIRKETGKTLEVYLAISDEGITASTGINVVIEGEKITNIYLDESYNPQKNPLEMIK